MKIKHPNITSSLFKLIDVYEIDIVFNVGNDNEDSYTLKIELFKSLSDPHIYRSKFWRGEWCRLQPTSPFIINNEASVIDAEVFVPEGQRYMESGEFKADNDEEALDIILASFSKSMEHITGSAPKIIK